jgi:hypothetical protein
MTFEWCVMVVGLVAQAPRPPHGAETPTHRGAQTGPSEASGANFGRGVRRCGLAVVPKHPGYAHGWYPFMWAESCPNGAPRGPPTGPKPQLTVAAKRGPRRPRGLTLGAGCAGVAWRWSQSIRDTPTGGARSCGPKVVRMAHPAAPPRGRNPNSPWRPNGALGGLGG